jgi:hypothetical protein
MSDSARSSPWFPPRPADACFASQPAPQLTIANPKSETKGDVAWVRFDWTRTRGTDSRKGVATAILTRVGGAWKVAQIQNSPSGHASH